MSTLCVHDSVYVRELFTTFKGYGAIEKLHVNLALSVCSGRSIRSCCAFFLLLLKLSQRANTLAWSEKYFALWILLSFFLRN